MNAGDKIVRSDTEHILFVKTSSDTAGELVEVEVSYRPFSPKPQLHYHPYQEERFEVLGGKFDGAIGGQAVSFEPGDRFEVPVGVPHWMHNNSPEPGRLLWQTRPALKTETFFETIWKLGKDGKLSASGNPDFWQSILLGTEFSDEFRVAAPPYIVQRMAFALLAPIARFKGYQGTYR